MTGMSLGELANLPPLTEDELAIINNARPTPSEDCPELAPQELKQFRPWYDRQKQTVTIDMDIDVVLYFKRLSVETGLSYQELMKMYLSQCMKERKKPMFV